MLAASIPVTARAAPDHPWLRGDADGESLTERIRPPAGYRRISATEGSFAAWLRDLPLRRAGTRVRLFDGSEKRRQESAFAVVDIDVGAKDLQQCADAVIRLRAEYLLAAGCADEVAFAFTSGHPARWSDWRAGRRPVVAGSAVAWPKRSEPDSSYPSFRRYLDAVFTYAGSYSLARELKIVADPSQVLPGDVFIQGGFPGHAELVADVAENAHGHRVFLLVQSYMPAQDIHVLVNPARSATPCIPRRRPERSRRPNGPSPYSDRRRFPRADCDELGARRSPALR